MENGIIKNKQEWMEFEHSLNYLLIELDVEKDIEDVFNLSEIKQSIITFSIGIDFGENNEVFLANNKHFFYESLTSIETKHPDTKMDIKIIKDFVEKYLIK